MELTNTNTGIWTKCSLVVSCRCLSRFGNSETQEGTIARTSLYRLLKSHTARIGLQPIAQSKASGPHSAQQDTACTYTARSLP